MSETSVMRRPFSDKGVLVWGHVAPREPKAILAACEEQLLQHLGAVCLWPEEERNRSWRNGDTSFYVLDFHPEPEICVYVQFLSEAGTGGTLVEVSSGAWNPPTDRFVDAGKRELLREHGFEMGGEADNFRKKIGIANAEDVRAAAREAMAIFTDVMGYDGRQKLRYELTLEARVVVPRVLQHISPDALARSLNEWGFMAELKRLDGQPPRVESRIDRGQLEVLFGDETGEGSDEYQALTLRASGRAEDNKARERADRLNRGLAEVESTVDDDGNNIVVQPVPMHGGVTTEQLRAQFHLLRRVISEIARHVEPRGRPLTEEESKEFARRRLEAALGGDVCDTLSIRDEEYAIIHGRPFDFSRRDTEMYDMFEACSRVGAPVEQVVPTHRGRYRRFLGRPHSDLQTKPEVVRRAFRHEPRVM